MDEFMQCRNYSDYYSQFSKLAYNMRDASSAKAKELWQEISQFIHNDFPSVVLGLIYSLLQAQFEMLESNGQDGQDKDDEENKFRLEISFSTERIVKALSYEWFAKDRHTEILNKTQSFLEHLPVLSDGVHDVTRISYRTEVIFYNSESENMWHLVYVDVMNEELVDFYKAAYLRYVLPRVYQMYQNPAIRFQVDKKGFCIASDDNFQEQHAFTDVSIYNVGRLIESLLGNMQKNHRIVTDYELELCFQVQILHKLFHILKIIEVKDHTPHSTQSRPTHTAAKTLNPIEQKIKTTILQLFKTISMQTQVLYFKTQEQYIDMILTQHQFFSREDVLKVFNTDLHPLPPGISRFSISVNTSNGKQRVTYFIPLKHVGLIFQQCTVKNDFFDLTHVLQRHFFLFLREIIHEYESVNYSESKIASIFHCTVDMVHQMRKVLANTRIR